MKNEKFVELEEAINSGKLVLPISIIGSLVNVLNESLHDIADSLNGDELVDVVLDDYMDFKHYDIPNPFNPNFDMIYLTYDEFNKLVTYNYIDTDDASYIYQLYNNLSNYDYFKYGLENGDDILNIIRPSFSFNSSDICKVFDISKDDFNEFILETETALKSIYGDFIDIYFKHDKVDNERYITPLGFNALISNNLPKKLGELKGISWHDAAYYVQAVSYIYLDYYKSYIYSHDDLLWKIIHSYNVYLTPKVFKIINEMKMKLDPINVLVKTMSEKILNNISNEYLDIFKRYNKIISDYYNYNNPIDIIHDDARKLIKYINSLNI